MINTNAYRNKVIYQHWEKGDTIDSTSLLTGIPRSTVGYYYRKFNNYAKEGKPVVIPSDTQKKQETLIHSALAKCIAWPVMIDMIQRGELEKVYYYLSIQKLWNELNYWFTPEENRAFTEALGGQFKKTTTP